MLESVFATVSLADGIPDRLQYLPQGTHEISATVNGQPGKRTVHVKQGIEAAFNRDLETMRKQNVRPFVNFSHDASGKAAALPKRFEWDAEKGGLMLEVEWSGSGRKAVEDKDFSYFSGEFHLGKDGTPAGLNTQSPSIGALTNNPAFTNISRIAASKADPPQPQKTMADADYTPLVEAGLLTASEAKQEDAAKIAAAKHTELVSEASNTKEIESIKAEKAKADEELTELKKKVEGFEKVAAERLEEDAKAFVAESIKAGKIAPADDKAQERWTKLFKADPENAKGLMEDIQATKRDLKPIERKGKEGKHTDGSDGLKPEQIKAAQERAAKNGTDIAAEIQAELVEAGATY